MRVVEREDFDSVLNAVAERGFELIGPTVKDNAIVYDRVHHASDFPIGLTDEQERGMYRLRETGQPALFSFAVGPRSPKNFLYPSRKLLWRARGNTSAFSVETENLAVPRYAFIGLRSCELHAIAIQDKVFLEGEYVDPDYKARREQAFIITVNCGHPGNTCFCVSMGTGPKAQAHYDLALTEVFENARHYFTVECGSASGAAVLDKVKNREAALTEVEAAQQVVDDAAGRMGRSMDTTNIRELLYKNAESPRWEETARRCLTCANCTMVCPTCFCSTVEDTTSLSGDLAERWRVWDSCYAMDFSYIHGGSLRKSGSSRYRQWITHKLASWYDQFGTSGCVGCGRCITWCPVGIDITEEVAALRDGIVEQSAREGD